MAMDFTDAARASYGLEIEQGGDNITRSYRRTNRWSWHRDGSGPMETNIGPYKLPKFLLNEFYRGTREEGHTWSWTAASDTTGSANGHGSHIHFHLEAPADASREDKVEAWTISYNTIVELTPVFAPFWCHDWENGFRHGTTYPHRSGLNVRQWAAPQTTRLSQSSVEREVIRERASRNYDAVTLNGGHDKPITIELRLNDAFPAMAIAGISILKKIVVAAVERGWSPKRSDDSIGLSEMYGAIYDDAADRGLLAAMRRTREIEYQDGRGIPRVGDGSFDSMWDLLEQILESRHPKPGRFKKRAVELVKAGRDRHSPSNNEGALWDMNNDRGDFSWTTVRLRTE
jgi:hypothetical protein